MKNCNMREATNIALSYGKIDKYEYLTGKEILMEQAKFSYFPLGKALEKPAKTIEDQAEKQLKEI